MPGSPGVPGKPRAPCRRKSKDDVPCINDSGRYKHPWVKQKSKFWCPYLYSGDSSVSRFSRSAIVTLWEEYKRGCQDTACINGALHGRVRSSVLLFGITALTSSPFLPGGPGGPRAPTAPCNKMIEREISIKVEKSFPYCVKNCWTRVLTDCPGSPGSPACPWNPWGPYIFTEKWRNVTFIF